MQITANTPLVLPNTQSTQLMKETVMPDFFTPTSATNSPATLVSFSGTKDAADIYEQPTLINVIQMSNTSDKGEVASLLSQKLAADTTTLRAYKSPLSASSLFNQVGALSRETSSYKNAAFSYQVANTKANEKLKLKFSDTNGTPQQTVTLRVHTKDGDTIDVKIQHSRGSNGDNLELSFDVKGKLSEAEQDALEKLANKLGQVADEFFRTGTTELHGLKEFDQANLKDFHIEFSKIKSADTYSTLSYDYSVDEQTQHLRAKDSDGYSFDISADLQDLLGTANISFNQSLENYLSIIRKTLNEHNPLQQEHSNTSSMRFIIDGLTSMLSSTRVQTGLAESSTTEQALDAFDTGLPDFTAVINAPLFIYRNPKKELVIPENMTLRLAQHTETKTLANGDIIAQQINSFERQSQQIAGITGSEKGDIETGNFTHKTIHEKQETSRTLVIGQEEIENLINNHTESKDTSVETYFNFNPTDTKKEEQYKHAFTQLADEVSKYKELKQAFNRLHYVAESHKNLFS